MSDVSGIFRVELIFIVRCRYLEKSIVCRFSAHESFDVAGLTDMIIRMFPPFPIPGFAPNFTGYEFLRNMNWNEVHMNMSQPPDQAIAMVSSTQNVP